MSRSFSSSIRHRLARAAAVVGLAATVVFVSAPEMASAATVPLAGSTFSISSPGSLSGTSGQAITPVQFVASNVDASTAPATTSITWVAGQIPAGLTLSATGRLSGTLSASIPGGVFDLRVIATEKVTTKSRGNQSFNYVTADFATQISITGPSVASSNPTIIGSDFYVPSGVAVDSSGRIFVAENFGGRVVRMDSDGSNQTVIASGFSWPFGVAVDSSGQVFVADTGNNQVVRIDSDGSNQTTIGSWFHNPVGVAVDTSGHVFVADNSNGRIVRMDVDGSNQTTISSIWQPFGVAVDSSGHLFVTVAYTGRTVRMDADGSNQTVIASGFSDPSGVAVDASGHVFVTDTGNHQVVRMNSDGSNQTTIGSGFSFPSGVAVETSGHVLVADSTNRRIVRLNAGFTIPDQTIPNVEAGQALVATQLVSALVDPSTSPRVTSVKWFAASLPVGLKLSSTGVLSGTPKAALDAGTYSIYATATERVTTKIGKVTTVTTKTTSRVLQIVIT